MNGAQNDTQQAGYQQAPLGDGVAGQPGYTEHMHRPGAPISQKSPLLATLYSLMPGLGQIYVGYYHQGFVNILLVASTITLIASNSLNALEPFLGVSLAFFWLYNMIDANRRAHHYNRAMAGLGGEPVPDDFKIPRGGGSTTAGVILIVVGVLFFLDLNYGVSMEWIEDWWPMILVAVGIRMIFKARQNRG